MTADDLNYVQRLLADGTIHGPVLELGVGWGGATCREMIISGGLPYRGTDISPGSAVDHVADFVTGSGVDQIETVGPFGTVLVLNVLEHTFDPIRVLDNVVRLTASGGAIVCIAPAAWPIHNYPRDYVRLLPDWYREYAATRNLALGEQHFDYIGLGRVAAYQNGSLDCLPPPSPENDVFRLYSRIIHRVFNTFGRGVSAPAHVGIGCVFRKTTD